ncbi:MAG: HEAT repeat domain-containing protein [Desulfatiglandaceae bacterium]
MKRLPLIIGIALMLNIYMVASCGYVLGKTLYYSPVVNYSGEKIAYVKRKLDYSSWGGSIIPFMGEPAKVKVKSDRIQVCEKDLKSGKEVVLEDWKIPLVKTDNVGNVGVILNWDLEKLRYAIKLSRSGYGKINLGKYQHPYWWLTNTKAYFRLKQGPATAAGVRAGVSERAGGRFPTSNKLIVENTWEEAVELPRVKQEMEAQIEESLNRLKTTLSDPEKNETVKAQILRAERFGEFVKKQAPDDLPEKLIDVFLKRSPRIAGEYPDLKPYVIMLGESGVDPLVEKYYRASTADRQHILDLLGGIGSTASLALIRKEMYAEIPDIQKEAVTALGMIKQHRAEEELDAILAEGRISAPAKKAILLQLKKFNAPKWHTTVLRTAMADDILYEELPTIVPDLTSFPVLDVWKQLTRIFERLESNNYKACQVSKQLIFAFDHKRLFKGMYPILGDLLKARFDFGKTVDTAGRIVYEKNQPVTESCLWGKESASILLDRMENSLSRHDFVDWHYNASRHFDSQLKQLYTEHLYLKHGGQIINRPPVGFIIEVTVKDSKGTIYASDRHIMILEEPAILQGKPLVAGYPVHSYQGRIELDRKNWRLKMDAFQIDFKPPTVSFSVNIPFGGSYERVVEEVFQGKKRAFWWTIRHIDSQKVKLPPRFSGSAIESAYERDRQHSTQ